MEAFKELKNYRNNYACHEERSDLYAYFIERGHKVLRKPALWYDCLEQFFRANYGSLCALFLCKNASFERVTDFAGVRYLLELRCGLSC